MIVRGLPQAERIVADAPQEVVNVQRNQFFWPTAYEVRFRDGRQGVYDAGSGNLLSGSGPANVQPGILQITPQRGLRVGPFMMPAGSGGGLPIRVPVVPQGQPDHPRSSGPRTRNRVRGPLANPRPMSRRW